MKIKKRKTSIWIIRLIGIFIGLAAGWIFYKTNLSLFSIAGIVYHKVGITIIALLPLSLWAVYSAISAQEGSSELTLAYIGTTAQRIGLLGTVIGIVAATISISDNLTTGAAMAVTGALPAVGQALVSTAVGFVISIICDFFIYVNANNPVKEEVEYDSGQ